MSSADGTVFHQWKLTLRPPVRMAGDRAHTPPRHLATARGGRLAAEMGRGQGERVTGCLGG